MDIKISKLERNVLLREFDAFNIKYCISDNRDLQGIYLVDKDSNIYFTFIPSFNKNYINNNLLDPKIQLKPTFSIPILLKEINVYYVGKHDIELDKNLEIVKKLLKYIAVKQVKSVSILHYPELDKETSTFHNKTKVFVSYYESNMLETVAYSVD